MAFQNFGSYQKNAAPLQSFVKQGGVSIQPNPGESMKSPSVPRPKQPQDSAGGRQQKQLPPGIEPVFAYLIFRYGLF